MGTSIERPNRRRTARWRKGATALVAVAAAASTATVASAGASSQNPDYPVPYTFVTGITAGAAGGPETAPPGSNISSCKPSAAHPYPVVLVHGLLANQDDNWQTFSPLLADNGYCVFSLTYGQNPSFASTPLDEFGGLEDMRQSAAVLGAFIDQVLQSTGARQVDILGHSEGATMPDYYLKYLGGASKVHDFVGLAPVVHGTDVADPAMIDELTAAFGGSSAEAQLLDPVCVSCSQFAPDSAFTQALDAGGVAVPGVHYTQIMTRYDELVVPYTNGEIDAPDATNIVIQDVCPTDFSDHVALAADPVAAQLVLDALDPATARPVVCTVVAPGVAGP